MTITSNQIAYLALLLIVVIHTFKLSDRTRRIEKLEAQVKKLEQEPHQ